MTRTRGAVVSRSGVLVTLSDQVDVSVSANRHGFTTVDVDDASLVIEGRPLIVVASPEAIIISTSTLANDVADRDAIAEWANLVMTSMASQIPDTPQDGG